MTISGENGFNRRTHPRRTLEVRDENKNAAFMVWSGQPKASVRTQPLGLEIMAVEGGRHELPPEEIRSDVVGQLSQQERKDGLLVTHALMHKETQMGQVDATSGAPALTEGGV